MISLRQIKKTTLFTLVYSFLVLNTAYSDDTEIFFAKTDIKNQAKPNILFIIDTSGSMTNTVDSGETRLQVVKDVMSEVLTNVKNANVGLMRYNRGEPRGFDLARGGPILHPVTDIDKPIDPNIVKIISNGSNDASQLENGVVSLNTEVLKLGETANALVAVRFNGLQIPQGATISSAKLSFSAVGPNQTNNSQLTIAGQLVGNAPALTKNNNNLSDREDKITDKIDWSINETWKNGNIYSTPDLTPVVQEIVNQGDWCGANSMVFLIKGSGKRSIFSLEGSVANSNQNNYYVAPKLRITFENQLPAGANGCFQKISSTRISNNKHDWVKRDSNFISNALYLLPYDSNYASSGVGLSFNNVNVPAGADIKRAYLSFSSVQDATTSGKISIKGVRLVNPNLTDYANLNQNATIGPVDWSQKEWSENESVKTTDISSIIKTIIGLNGWTQGSSISLTLEGDADMNGAAMFAYSPFSSEQPASLHIEYQTEYQPDTIKKRDELINAIAELPADGYTPISDVMAEAGLYFRGGKVTYGIDRDGASSNRVSHPDSWDKNTGTLLTPPDCDKESDYSSPACADEKITGNPNYISPVKAGKEGHCQSNNIVLLTDGEPTSHHSLTEEIYKTWAAFRADDEKDNDDANDAICLRNSDDGDYGSNCAKKIAGILANPGKNAPEGTPKVNTYTIGFAADFELLKNMAEAGGGKYFTANNKDELIKKFDAALNEIENTNSSFVSVGVSVNQLNQLTNSEEIYFSLFSPATEIGWPGNVKRYKLGGDGTILDKNNRPAIDGSKFSDAAQSFWSDSADGSNVSQGGVAENLGYQRKVYSNITGSTDITLTAPDNIVKKGNVSITSDMLLASSIAQRNNILDWARGLDIVSDQPKSHNIIGDPLHSSPTVVAYKSNGTIKSNLFVGTNNGFLSSFNTVDGTENWAFIPKQLLSQLKPIMEKNKGDHIYGIDGSISIYKTDENKNGLIDNGEKAYLYVGMRRGGSSYYALDISQQNQPKLMFTINPNTDGFGLLGQTWSKPFIGKINIGGKQNRQVLIFGGGYDIKQDTAGTPSVTDQRGNRIYIVDALTGKLLWNSSEATLPAGSQASDVSSMNSVPANVTAFDLDDDGLLDHIYASDTKAQVFRFDINNDQQTIVGGRIAHLQSAADIANNRRFYYQPDVALIRLKHETFISISIGSGYRAHPLDKNITDYFYMIKDKGVLAKKFDMDVSMEDLLDVSDLVGYDQNGKSIPGEKLKESNKRGWYIGFTNTGEKVIERSITYSNTVIFTSYLPPSSITNGCNAQAGASRRYMMDIADGNPYQNNGGDDTLDKNDRYVDLEGGGIAPPPQILIPTNQSGKIEPQVCIGLQCDKAPVTPNNVMGLRWKKGPYNK
ncbi:PilC/PilY family type IV pilus protein [Aliikangiella sp. IMCC44359]|uniref:PilC/PilY family type IV pilus protein n=1 Tax=Aliikangiella sp. IMCC44359 TaxID=3459125 RepID=UPI00403A8811